MSLRNLPSPSQKDPGGEFVVQKTMTIGGVNFLPGDTLPLSNVVRTMPSKLNLLCRIRVLRQVAAPATVTQSVDTTVGSPAEEPVSDVETEVVESVGSGKPSTVELKTLSRKKLVALAKERGVSHEGDDKAIRIRIRKSYE